MLTHVGTCDVWQARIHCKAFRALPRLHPLEIRMDQRPLTPSEANERSTEEFKAKYMTTADVMEYMNVSRTSIYQARKTGRIPFGINVDTHITLWERALLMPHLLAWKAVLDAKWVREHMMSSTVVSSSLQAQV